MAAKKLIAIILCVIASLFLIAYLTPVLTSIDTYYPGTIINGKDYSFKSPLFVENEMHVSPADYELKIKFRDGTEILNGKDIAFSIDYMNQLENIKASQNPFLWLGALPEKKYNISTSVRFDEALLDLRLDDFEELDVENMKYPENPRIKVNDEDGTVEALLGDQGNYIKDIDGLCERIKEAILNQESTIDVDDEGFYLEPDYSSEDPKIQSCLDFCNSIADLKIKYMYGEDYTLPIPANQLLGVVDITENYNCSINKEKVRNLVTYISALNDTYGKDRTFTTHNMKKITLSNADYGWQIDIDKETDDLYNDIVNRADVTRTPSFSSTAFTYDEYGNDIGGSYCEVDLTEQHVYIYQNGSLLMDSACVTGNTALRRGTPPGLYYIVYKQSPAILKGDDYETPVTYWMPFVRGIGFHDATWRGSFGGTIYQYNGSHGCVNLPYSFAQQLFYVVEAGMPVIVHE